MNLVEVHDAQTKKICQERIHMHILAWKEGVLVYTTKRDMKVVIIRLSSFLSIYVLLTGIDLGEKPMKR